MGSLHHFVYLVALYTYLSPVKSHAWNGSHFLCHGRNRCYDDQLHCDASKACTIDCFGPNACQYAVIHCPTDASCDVRCGGGIDACKDVVFLAKHSTSLTISCDRTYEESFDQTLIYCPDNGSGGDIACHISGVSEINVATKMEIFAVEGLNDVEISGTYVTLATVYCKMDYSASCKLINASPFNRCASAHKTCQHYLKPTPAPTQEPSASTNTPTNAPTSDPITTLYPTSDPTATTITPTYAPTSAPISDPITTLFPTSEPTIMSTLFPTDNSMITTVTTYDDEANTPTPTMPTGLPTKEPTFTPTGRPRDLEYTPRPTRFNPRYAPTSKPTPRPTRKTLWGALSHTTTTQIADIALNLIEDDTDTEDDDEDDTNKSDLKPLYYGIGALFVSICFVSVSLFIWVHYNQKYTNKVMEIKERRSKSQFVEPNVPTKRSLPPIPPLPPYSFKMAKIKHLQVQGNRPRFRTASVGSSAAPTSDHAPTSAASDCSYAKCSVDIEDNALKEVNYETNAGIVAQDGNHAEQRTFISEKPVIIGDDDDDDEFEEEEFKEVDYATSIGGERMKNTAAAQIKQMHSSSTSSRPIPNSMFSMGIPMSSVSASQAYGFTTNMYRSDQRWPTPPPPPVPQLPGQ